MHKPRRLYRSDSARGVMGKWSDERERDWEREHSDALAWGARQVMRAWVNTLTPAELEQIGEQRRHRRAAKEKKKAHHGGAA